MKTSLTSLIRILVAAFRRKLGLKIWSSFNDLIIELTNDNSVGNFVITTDIANFYDNIDIAHLCDNLVRDASSSYDIVKLLKIFLGLWDRITKGYSVSSKGIPQEIIGDASRLLANYYLHEFDEKFLEYCNNNNLRYIRWADDMVVFGKSRLQLELAIHKASRIILSLGLHLNALKTRVYTRCDFKMHRGVDVLHAINVGNSAQVIRKLRKFNDYAKEKPARTDTVFKALLGYSIREEKMHTSYVKNYIEECSKIPEILLTFNNNHYFNRLLIADSSLEALRNDLNLITKYPYAAPKAAMLTMLRKKTKKLNRVKNF